MKILDIRKYKTDNRAGNVLRSKFTENSTIGVFLRAFRIVQNIFSWAHLGTDAPEQNIWLMWE